MFWKRIKTKTKINSVIKISLVLTEQQVAEDHSSLQLLTERIVKETKQEHTNEQTSNHTTLINQQAVILAH